MGGAVRPVQPSRREPTSRADTVSAAFPTREESLVFGPQLPQGGLGRATGTQQRQGLNTTGLEQQGGAREAWWKRAGWTETRWLEFNSWVFEFPVIHIADLGQINVLYYL